MGPLSGLRILEIAGIGPGPFCAMMLADQGAEIIRIDRLGGQVMNPGDPRKDILNRGKRSLAIDLKSPRGVDLILGLVAKSDGLIEGFRPGVMERLGLGPDICLKHNPNLIYGRITGWGQDGPWAQMAGHDIDYIALSGALHAFGRAGERPTPPINMVGDFGGGGMLMAFGMVSALLNVARNGAQNNQGQVVDAAMLDGSALLMAMVYSFKANGFWQDERGVNLLDTGAHFYEVYETLDGKHLAIGAIEPAFYQILLEKTGLKADKDFADYMTPAKWPGLKQRLGEVIKTRTRSEWEIIFEGSDGCVAPVLSLNEAPQHPHNKARNVFPIINGITNPAPAPRFSQTPAGIPGPAPIVGEDSIEILRDLDFPLKEIEDLRSAGVIKDTGKGHL